MFYYQQCVICPKKGEGRVCEDMHARAIHNVLTQGWTVKKSGSNYPNPPANHTLIIRWLLSGVTAHEVVASSAFIR